MNKQYKIDQLEAHNRALVGFIMQLRGRYSHSDHILKWSDEALSNSPVDLYHKEQEVIEASIKWKSFSEYSLDADSADMELAQSIANLQQARQEQE